MAKEVEDSAVEEHVRRVMSKVEALVRETLSRDIRPLHEIEVDVDRVGDIIKETLTKEVIDQVGEGYVDSRRMCECGATAKFAGTRKRQMITLHGRLSFPRSYYYCWSCRSGFCPTDKLLGLGNDDCSRTVKAYAARVSSYLPFERAAYELKALRRIPLSATAVQWHAKAVGDQIGTEWDERQAKFRFGAIEPSEIYPKRLYLCMDAAKCHVSGRWHDVKLAAAYHRSDSGMLAYAEYYGSLETSDKFGGRLPVLAHIAGGDNCTDLQMLGDGAAWIWNETTKHTPAAVQTLDFYHLEEHVDAVAAAQFDARSGEARKRWIQQQKANLLNSREDLVISNIAAWKSRSKAARDIRDKAVAYMRSHRHRMNYQTLREQGRDIGSGLIESGCRNVVKARLSSPGMHWEAPGAAAVMHLSTFWRGDRPADYLKYTS